MSIYFTTKPKENSLRNSNAFSNIVLAHTHITTRLFLPIPIPISVPIAHTQTSTRIF
jgi:hypothetical protein